jgi:hypothetical protein
MHNRMINYEWSALTNGDFLLEYLQEHCGHIGEVQGSGQLCDLKTNIENDEEETELSLLQRK